MSSYDVPSFNLDFFSPKKSGDLKTTDAVIIDIPHNITPEVAAKQIPSMIEQGFIQLTKIKDELDEAQKEADIAYDAARAAYCKDVGFWHRTVPALEALQSAVRSQSNAQIQLSKAQYIMFEQQQILANCSKILFFLCLNNLASARVAVKEIKIRLEGASEEEISEVARQEMGKVLEQLKQQMDMMEKQERLENKVLQLEERKRDMVEKQECLENKILQLEERIITSENAAEKACDNTTKNKGGFWKFVARSSAFCLFVWALLDLHDGRWVMMLILVVVAFFLWVCSDDSPSTVEAKDK